MLNILIFSGGTGSIAIQNGLSAIYGNENYNLDIIINAYDNGKSTGICRKVFDGQILGPSDLRKNHMTQFLLQKSGQFNDFFSRESVLHRLFELRIDADSKEDYYNYCCALLENNSKIIGEQDTAYLKSLLDYFFFESKNKWRDALDGIIFKDFSIANIFYSSAAVINGNSLRLAGQDMANFLHIKDNVHLISDVNLYLQAKTETGFLIEDEGDIVGWDNPMDKIESVFLLKDGKEYIPSVDEGTDLTRVKSCKKLIAEADIIIFSSGTQWSSLIPSYMHSGLRKMLDESKAKKYLVMNNKEDHDMKGVCADDIVEIISRYIPVDDITAVVNDDAADGMNKVTSIRSIHDFLSGDKFKHNPVKLVSLMMKDYFEVTEKNKTYIYDLDGTLWDERANNKGKAVGTENLNLFDGIIHSGNSYEHVRDVFKYLYHQEKEVHIYSDFGNIHFTSADDSKRIVSNKYSVNDDVITELEKIEAFKGKIVTRGGGAVVTIKPLINRSFYVRVANKCLQIFQGKYVARISGHTSIDITHKDYDKKSMLQEIMTEQRLISKNVIFVGNETEEGAEANIGDLGIKTIQVDDIYECNFLLRTINS